MPELQSQLGIVFMIAQSYVGLLTHSTDKQLSQDMPSHDFSLPF